MIYDTTRTKEQWTSDFSALNEDEQRDVVSRWEKRARKFCLTLPSHNNGPLAAYAWKLRSIVAARYREIRSVAAHEARRREWEVILAEMAYHDRMDDLLDLLETAYQDGIAGRRWPSDELEAEGSGKKP